MTATAIDIHSHIEFARAMALVRQRYSDEEIAARFGGPAAGPRSTEVNRTLAPTLKGPLREVDRKREDMAKRKLAFTVLSVAPPSFFYELDPELAVDVARLQNDLLAAVAEAHPQSFAAIATLPLQNPAAAEGELERAIGRLGLRGVEVGSHVGGRELGDRAFWPLYGILERAGLPLFIHPHHVAGIDRLQEYYLTNLIGNPLDTTIAAASLIFGGVFERHPNLQVVLAHGGGQLPYILGRLDHGYRVRPECRERVGQPPRRFLGNFHFDMLTHSDEALRYLVSLVGSDRVLLGTDYPFDMGDDAPVETVLRLTGLGEAERERILRGNAVALFRLNIG